MTAITVHKLADEVMANMIKISSDDSFKSVSADELTRMSEITIHSNRIGQVCQMLCDKNKLKLTGRGYRLRVKQ